MRSYFEILYKNFRNTAFIIPYPFCDCKPLITRILYQNSNLYRLIT